MIIEKEVRMTSAIDRLEATMKDLEGQIGLYKDRITQLTSAPFAYATVVYLNKAGESKKSSSSTAVIVTDGRLLEVLLPKNIEVAIGDPVTISTQTMQIISVATVQMGGSVGYVRQVIDETFSEVGHDSAVRIVFNGKFGTLEKGDRVVLDSSATVIVRNLGKDEDRFSYQADMNVTWNQIGGLENAKKQLIEAIELPLKHPEIFQFYKNKKPPKGILFYGPPGCGKTMLGKAVASSLAKNRKGDGKSNGFIYVKGPEILDRYVGSAEATVRQIFARARDYKKKFGQQAVIFIDEAEAVLAKRDSGISSDVGRTLVPTFLNEMGGLEDSDALVILATNRQDTLDSAIVRDGRIDLKIKIDRPTSESAVEIFNLNLKDAPLYRAHTSDEFAKIASKELFSPDRILYEISTRNRGNLNFTLANIVNGAMIAGVVNQATSIALQRDLKSGRRDGLRSEDLVEAINAIQIQNNDLGHSDALDEFTRDFSDEVKGIHRLRQTAK